MFYFVEEEFVRNLLNLPELGSMLVDDIHRFKNCLSCSNRIKVRGCDSIILYSKGSGTKFVIGPDSDSGSKHEVPTYPFRGLFNFIRSSRAQFEILWTEQPDFIVRHEHYSTYAAFDRVINPYPK